LKAWKTKPIFFPRKEVRAELLVRREQSDKNSNGSCKRTIRIPLHSFALTPNPRFLSMGSRMES